MSDIRGCIRCQTQFEVYYTHNRVCDKCKKIQQKERNRNNNRHIGEIFRECLWCKKIVDSSFGKKHCSHTCRTKYNNIPKAIKKAKKQIEKQQEKIVKLESLL